MSETTWAEKNRLHFDTQASTYDNSAMSQSVTASITAFLKTHIPNLVPVSLVSGRVLDFACGTGTCTLALASTPYFTTFRGMDISGSMAAAYNTRTAAQGLDARAVQADLADKAAFMPGSPVQGEEWVGFDVVIVANALHHIEKTELVLKRLVERCGEGGSVIVIDWAADVGDAEGGGEKHHRHQGHHGHGHEHDDFEKRGVVHRHGFSRARIEEMLKEAGCVDVEYFLFEEDIHFGPFSRRNFMVRGKKAPVQKLGFSKWTSIAQIH